jgi:hypothetical protein
LLYLKRKAAILTDFATEVGWVWACSELLGLVLRRLVVRKVAVHAATKPRSLGAELCLAN